ncbi:MAG: glycosyltransferase [Candidatus Scalindua sp.]|nr:glycosyltransferase [Candidatus Scalindua sp.]
MNNTEEKVQPEPLVSVIMTTYNAEKYLKTAIESIVKQTFQDFEFVILDDGSTDHTRDILKTYLQPNVILEFREHLGRAKALNTAITLSRGKYIANIDADDIALPERLEKQVKFLDENPDIVIVGSSRFIIDERTGKRRIELYATTDGDIRKEMSTGNPFFHSAVMLRKNSLEVVGMYNEKQKCSVDYELWARLLSKYKGANLKEPLAVKRQYANSSFDTNPSLEFYKIYLLFIIRMKIFYNINMNFRGFLLPFLDVMRQSISTFYGFLIKKF